MSDRSSHHEQYIGSEPVAPRPEQGLVLFHDYQEQVVIVRVKPRWGELVPRAQVAQDAKH